MLREGKGVIFICRKTKCQNILCTSLFSTVEVINGEFRAGEFKLPSQLKMFPWDVLNGSKVNVDDEDVSLVVEETVMSFPLETATPPVVKVAVGELIKPLIFDAVQVRL